MTRCPFSRELVSSFDIHTITILNLRRDTKHVRHRIECGNRSELGSLLMSDGDNYAETILSRIVRRQIFYEWGAPHVLQSVRVLGAGWPLVHGRHAGKANVGWLDGHAPSMAVIEFDLDRGSWCSRSRVARAATAPRIFSGFWALQGPSR